MSVLHRGRRQFLLGAGGFTLTLPLMRSLMPRAEAQATPVPKNFVAYATGHGGVSSEFMWPAASTLTEERALFSDHVVRRGALVPTRDGGRTVLSPVLSADSAALTDRIASKLNAIRGLDVPFYLNHHSGGHLGNFLSNASEASRESGYVSANGGYRPSIDQVMAWSPRFYSDLSVIRERSLVIGAADLASISFGYANPSDPTSAVNGIPLTTSPRRLFDRVFVPDSGTPQSSRTPVVDRVYQSYRQLRDGAFGDARRLSAADRRRLEDHMARLAEIQRRTNVVVSCGDVATPADISSVPEGRDEATVEATARYFQAVNDVIVAAFACGTSRIATVHCESDWSAYPTGLAWHEDIVHPAANNPTLQDYVWRSNQDFFERAFLDLANKLDAIEDADGNSLLDSSLLMWTQESGAQTHMNISTPVITAGSAGGFFRTGNYVDYQNKDVLAHRGDVYWQSGWDNAGLRQGILYRQWLGNVLQSMGIPPEEYEREGDAGYGVTAVGLAPDGVYSEHATYWPSRLQTIARDVVPFLGAGT